MPIQRIRHAIMSILMVFSISNVSLAQGNTNAMQAMNVAREREKNLLARPTPEQIKSGQALNVHLKDLMLVDNSRVDSASKETPFAIPIDVANLRLNYSRGGKTKLVAISELEKLLKMETWPSSLRAKEIKLERERIRSSFEESLSLDQEPQRIEQRRCKGNA